MKKTLMMLAIGAMAFGAKADLLYFMTSSFNFEGDTSLNFDYAMVGVAKDGTATWGNGDSQVYLNILSTPGSTDSSQFLASTPDGYYTVAGPAWADVSDYTADGYTFYVETYKNGADSPIWGYSEDTAQSYAQLLAAGHIYTDSTAAQSVTPWSVPEPSSGLLLLLGLAGLALKRRRAR